MNKILIKTLVLCFIAVVSASDDKLCEDGSRWKTTCNWCNCVNGKPSCTKRMCRPGVEVQKECIEGSRWKHDDNCNWCSCEGGVPACTELFCFFAEPEANTPLKNVELTTETNDMSVCVNGTTWKQDCSTCTCIDGVTFCDKKICHLDPDAKCTEGSRWKKECNWCRCAEGKGICTRRGCPPGFREDPKESVCEGDSRWKVDDCNWCQCSEGKAICTLKECLPTISSDNKGEPEGECVDGSRWKKDCNWCNCVKGKGLCTKRACLPGFREDPNEKVCEGESRWKSDDCNWCQCNEGKAACTLRACLSTPLIENKQEGEPEGECVEGSRWKKDCNWCNCIEGKGVCTKMFCRPGFREDPNEKVCEGESRWKNDDCNWCQCNEGKAACTLRACLSTPLIEEKQEGEPQGECVEGSRWKKDCNWCNCIEGKGVCTKMSCRPGFREDPNEKVCEDESRWRIDDCNWCQCSEGKAACTLKACLNLIQGRTREPEDECIEGSRWKKDCNWCNCVEGKGICTKMACRPGFREDPNEKVCEGESRWKSDDCNWCQCSDGKAACTLRACLPSSPTPLDQNKNAEIQCKEGSRWRFDCNWCSCVDGVPLCTKRLCLGEDPLKGQCDVGSEWKQDCNWCTCISGTSICSTKECPTERNTGDGECTKGSRWKDNCNWCNCDNGRKACTKRFCPPALKDPEDGHCEGNSKWKKDCNWCECTDGVGSCTEKLCQTDKNLETRIRKPKPNVKCIDGSKWKNPKHNCNWCSCVEGLPLCTLVHCPSDEKAEIECQGNSMWMKDECNWCKCTNKVGVCTQKKCNASDGPSVRIAPVPKSEPEKKECEQGSRWRSDCNWCNCVNGIRVCTKMACMNTELKNAQDTEDNCIGNSSWLGDDNCNWCSCHDGRASCTLKFCPTSNLPDTHTLKIEDRSVHTLSRTLDFECTNGSTWWNNNHTLHCICDEKNIAMCNIVNENSNISKDITCTSNSRWKQNCNWCICVKGRSVCTKRFCETDIQPIVTGSATVSAPMPTTNHSACTEGHVWEEGCNKCVCKDGNAACTMKSCISEPLKAPASPTCTEGEKWNDGCNDCVCHKGKALCTRKLCGPVKFDFEENLPNVCLQAVQISKNCSAPSIKFFYNRLINDCEPTYGCKEGSGVFGTLSECLITCGLNEKHQKQFYPAIQGKSDRCFMEKDPGPCFGFMKRFAFNPQNNRCEMFTFGGCQGNQNNFASAQLCYDTCGGNFPVADPNCDRRTCSWKFLNHYFARRCKAQYSGGSCCPTSFLCKTEEEQNMSPRKCYINNKEYPIRRDVTISTGNPCEIACICDDDPYQQRATVLCNNIECPSIFRPPTPGCRRVYGVTKCCSIGEDCGEPDSPHAIERTVTCKENNKEYKGGDRIYFDGADSCQECVCTNDYNGPYGPGCRQINCGLEYRYRKYLYTGCIPVYHENVCCPLNWICPDSELIGEQRTEPVNKDSSSNVCFIGNQIVPLGEFANITDCDIKCSCIVPPDVTCIHTKDCVKYSMRVNKSDLNCPPGCTPIFNSKTMSIEECSCEQFDGLCPEPECPKYCRDTKIILNRESGCRKCVCV